MTIKTSNRWNEIWAHNIWTSFWIRPDFGKAHNEWNCTEASRAFIEFIVLSVVLLFVNIKWRHCDWKCTVATQTQHTQTHTLSHRMMIQLWCFSSVCTRWLNGKWHDEESSLNTDHDVWRALYTPIHLCHNRPITIRVGIPERCIYNAIRICCVDPALDSTFLTYPHARHAQFYGFCAESFWTVAVCSHLLKFFLGLNSSPSLFLRLSVVIRVATIAAAIASKLSVRILHCSIVAGANGWQSLQVQLTPIQGWMYDKLSIDC